MRPVRKTTATPRRQKPRRRPGVDPRVYDRLHRSGFWIGFLLVGAAVSAFLFGSVASAPSSSLNGILALVAPTSLTFPCWAAGRAARSARSMAVVPLDA